MSSIESLLHVRIEQEHFGLKIRASIKQVKACLAVHDFCKKPQNSELSIITAFVKHSYAIVITKYFAKITNLFLHCEVVLKNFHTNSTENK